MNRNNWFSALTITLLIVLLGAAGCITAASSQETAPAPNTGNILATAPQGEASGSSAPTTAIPPDNTTIGNDPVSGQSGEVDLSWEQLCLSSEYQVQIAKDPGFTIIVLDTGPFAPSAPESPGAYYPAGGSSRSPSSLTGWGNLEAGHTYYWRARVREAATGQHMLSPWSAAQSFTAESGTQTSATSYGIQAISPNNGRNTAPVNSTSFSWTPLNDITKYRFVLARDAAMTEVIVDDVVTTTAYHYQGQLDYSQAYFWKVMALEPAPSDWSATFTFQTEAAPAPAPAESATQTPTWAWLVIAASTVLLVATIVLTIMLRRR